MRDQGVKAPLMGGDGITTDEFAQIGGPGVEGTLMTFGPDPRKNPAAKDIVKEFRAKKFEPEAYTLYSYAAVQIIKQAAEEAKSLDPKKVAEKMHSGMPFKTVIGDIAYDKKGDITSASTTSCTSGRRTPTARSPTSSAPAATARRRSRALKDQEAKSPPRGGLFFVQACEWRAWNRVRSLQFVEVLR